MQAQEVLPDARAEKQRGARGWRAGALTVESPHARFGDRYQGETVRHRWTISHRGAAPVRVERALAVDEVGTVEIFPEVIEPGETALVTVTRPLGAELGEASFRYALISDEPGVGRYRFTLSGFVQSAFDPEVAELRFPPSGPAQGAGTSGTAEVEVASREVDRLEIVRAVDPPAYLDLAWSSVEETAGSPVRLTATLLPSAPVGLVGGRFALETNVVHQPLLWVVYSGTVYRELIPSANPVALGAVTLGTERESEVEIRRASGEPFGEISVSTDSAAVVATAAPCREPADSCRSVRLLYTPRGEGPLIGTLTVEAEGAEPLPVRFHAVAVSGATRVRQLDLEGEG